VKPSLRELFLSDDAFAPESDPLIRLGALHHLHRTIDRDQMRPRLAELLGAYDVSVLQSREPESSIFPLHVAIALAEEGGADGINWLLRFLTSGSPAHQRLGFTALRNCRQFPLAVLVGSAVTPNGLESSQAILGDLTSFSEEEAWVLAQKGSAAERSAKLADMEVAISKISRHLRQDRRLARGMVITQPRRSEIGFRYTGFLIVEESPSRLRGVPYRMSSLINRDDGAASVSALDLVARPGREVFVVYDAGGDCEAQVVYAIPFADVGPVAQVMARGAISCDGLTIGVLANKSDTGSGFRYRLITAEGDTDVVNRRYTAWRQDVGTCVLLHETSTMTLFSQICLPRNETEQVVSRFIEKTSLERAALLKTWDYGYKLGGQSGRIVSFGSDPPQDLVVLLEDKVINEVGHTFPVTLPLARWTAQDRSLVLREFFTNNPDSYAVVVDTVESERGNRMLIMHPESGRRELRRPAPEIRPGVPVFWEDGNQDKVYLTFLDDQLVSSNCHTCFDTGYRVCEGCDGSAKVTCPKCKGSRKSTCGHCNGSGERRSDCNGCRGTGSCGRCGGSATVTLNCTVCKGSGYYSDSGRPCKKCVGKGTFQGTCRVCTGGPQPKGKCPNCRGTGDYVQPCRTCSQSGLWNCDQCRATGITWCQLCNGSLVSRCGCGGNRQVRIVPAAQGRS
jgi:hypothetical protein